MPPDLDARLVAHYRAVAAPPAIRDRLVVLALDRRMQRRRVRWSAWSGLAAAALVAVILLATREPVTWASPPEIAASVAADHLYRKPDDIVSTRIGDLATGLPRLDFALRLPQRADLPRWRLDGGRYCSLAGNIAAQLRLTDDSGDLHTLYVARCAGALAGITDFSTRVDAVEVAIWREGQLAFAWARDAGQ